MPADPLHDGGELTDGRLDALVLDAVCRRMHSYETLVRSGPGNLPAGVRPGRDRLAASVARLHEAGYLSWFKEGTWLAASKAGRNHNLDLHHIDLRPGPAIVLDEPDVPAPTGRAATSADAPATAAPVDEREATDGARPPRPSTGRRF